MCTRDRASVVAGLLLGFSAARLLAISRAGPAEPAPVQQYVESHRHSRIRKHHRIKQTRHRKQFKREPFREERVPIGLAHYRIPTDLWARHRGILGPAFDWVRNNVPGFECSDHDLNLAYAYRWKVFHLHLKKTQDGFVLTEFLKHVNWEGQHGTINCAYGHHAADARWVQDPAVLDNYSAFWFQNPKADLRYTWWPAHAAVERFRLDGRAGPLNRLLPSLRSEYWRWVNRSSVVDRGHNECLWQAAHDDGEENSVGFDGCRPTINAAMYGEAKALAFIYALQADPSAARAFEVEASRWQRALSRLWSNRLRFYVTRTLPPPHARLDDVRRRRTKLGCQYCPRSRPTRNVQHGTMATCPPQWDEGELVTVRELAGLSWPWYHRAAKAEHAIAWRQIIDASGFAAPWGLTTAERRHPCFNFSTWCPTSWHGPIWPFETSKLGTALMHALQDPIHRIALWEHAGVGKRDFLHTLTTYARMMTRGRAQGVTAGDPFVGESFHPDDGYWLTRELLHQRRAGDRDRGDHCASANFDSSPPSMFY